MQLAKNLVVLVVVTCFVCALPQFALAQDKATPPELVSKVREAASVLSKSGEPGLADFDKKPGPWVWKDSYYLCSRLHQGNDGSPSHEGGTDRQTAYRT